MSITTSAVVHPADFEQAKVRIQNVDDGHIAVIHIDGLTIQASSDGDSTRTLVEGFRLLADKVEAAHREWLRTKAAEQKPAADEVECPACEIESSGNCRAHGGRG